MSDRFLPLFLGHLKNQFSLARPILFTGAGFSLSVKNILNKPMPSYNDLKALLWKIAYPDLPPIFSPV